MLAQKTTKPGAILAALKNNDLELSDYIDQLEKHFELVEPKIQSFVPEDGRFDRLRHDAIELESKYPDPKSRPPLFGYLIGIKDIFRVDGFPTKAGSNLPPDALYGSEAVSVTQLKNAGALIMGKTVTTEFAYFAPGPTRNPHNLAHTPGGSSSGSAAAVAAGLVPFAFGTQTIGSVNRPASFCGVYGYKPSYNRISKEGVIPLSTSLDHVGFFTPDLASAELAAEILVRDWQSVDRDRQSPQIGIPTGKYLENASSEMLDHFFMLVENLLSNGYSVSKIDAMQDFDNIHERHNLIVAAEAALSHQDLFKTYEELYHTKTSELIRNGQTFTADDLANALAQKNAFSAEISGLMEENNIDLWITPSAPGTAPYGLESTGNPVMNLPWTQSGLPTLTIPAGTAANGLPLGLQLTAKLNQDETLFAWGERIASGIQ
ncbi:MAG: amidase [Anaerolineae bacterium]|nr:amidase [Anaerolineae bacterium]